MITGKFKFRHIKLIKRNWHLIKTLLNGYSVASHVIVHNGTLYIGDNGIAINSTVSESSGDGFKLGNNAFATRCVSSNNKGIGMSCNIDQADNCKSYA